MSLVSKTVKCLKAIALNGDSSEFDELLMKPWFCSCLLALAMERKFEHNLLALTMLKNGMERIWQNVMDKEEKERVLEKVLNWEEEEMLPELRGQYREVVGRLARYSYPSNWYSVVNLAAHPHTLSVVLKELRHKLSARPALTRDAPRLVHHLTHRPTWGRDRWCLKSLQYLASLTPLPLLVLLSLSSPPALKVLAAVPSPALQPHATPIALHLLRLLPTVQSVSLLKVFCRILANCDLPPLCVPAAFQLMSWNPNEQNATKDLWLHYLNNHAPFCVSFVQSKLKEGPSLSLVRVLSCSLNTLYDHIDTRSVLAAHIRLLNQSGKAEETLSVLKLVAKWIACITPEMRRALHPLLLKMMSNNYPECVRVGAMRTLSALLCDMHHQFKELEEEMYLKILHNTAGLVRVAPSQALSAMKGVLESLPRSMYEGGWMDNLSHALVHAWPFAGDPSAQTLALDVLLVLARTPVRFSNVLPLLHLVSTLLVPNSFLLDRGLSLWNALLISNMRPEFLNMIGLLNTLVRSGGKNLEYYTEMMLVAESYIAYSPEQWNPDLHALLLLDAQYLSASLSFLRALLSGKTPQKWFDQSLSELLLELIKRQPKGSHVRALSVECYCRLWFVKREVCVWLPQICEIALEEEEYFVNKRAVCLYLCDGPVASHLFDAFASFCLTALEDLPELPFSNPLFFVVNHLRTYPLKDVVKKAIQNYPKSTIQTMDNTVAKLLKEKLDSPTK